MCQHVRHQIRTRADTFVHVLMRAHTSLTRISPRRDPAPGWRLVFRPNSHTNCPTRTRIVLLGSLTASLIFMHESARTPGLVSVRTCWLPRTRGLVHEFFTFLSACARSSLVRVRLGTRVKNSHTNWGKNISGLIFLDPGANQTRV